MREMKAHTQMHACMHGKLHLWTNIHKTESCLKTSWTTHLLCPSPLRFNQAFETVNYALIALGTGLQKQVQQILAHAESFLSDFLQLHTPFHACFRNKIPPWRPPSERADDQQQQSFRQLRETSSSLTFAFWSLTCSTSLSAVDKVPEGLAAASRELSNPAPMPMTCIRRQMRKQFCRATNRVDFSRGGYLRPKTVRFLHAPRV